MLQAEEPNTREARAATWPRVLVAICACLVGPACGTPQEAPPQDELRELVLLESPPEHEGDGLLDVPRVSHREMLERLDQVATEPGIKGLFLNFGTLGGTWARAAELRVALSAVREAKKPVHCHFESTDNVGYALMASVCDRISMAPVGLLDLVGVHARVVYARELLDLVGLDAEMIQVGRYKGAMDALTRTDMPPETRETLGFVLDDLQGTLRESVVSGRSRSTEEFDRVLDAGPHTARAALRLGLIDAIGFDDEARSKAKQAAQAKRIKRLSDKPEEGQAGLLQMLRALTSDVTQDRARGERIALAYLSGTIYDGEEPHGSGGVHAGPFVEAMRRIADDQDIRALVLRVDSPGGSAAASDRMWHAVRRVVKRKPVIVSIGDMAASGGYYVACAGSEILAQDESLVGSIGVVGGKIVAERLAQRAGVRVVELQRGRNAGWANPAARWNPGERAALEALLNETYQTFLSRVQLGRKLEGKELEAMAEGRIMTGRRAREGGLVDAEGGLFAALARARAITGLPQDTAIEVWPPRQSFVQRLARTLSGGAEARTLAMHALRSTLGDAGLALALVAGERGPFAVLPYSLDLR